MLRKLIVVGDPLATGGHVLPYEGQQYTVQNHHVALIGGRAYCEGCNSVGLIAKAGGPRRMQFISEVAWDLSRWEKADRSRVERWFGNSKEETRQHLRSGLSKCSGVLRGLTCANFIRYSEAWAGNVGCVLDGQTNVAAAVCGPDTRTRTIAININFCELRQLSPEKDSQLSTLIHEVTHFDDTFASKDTAYTFHKSLELADSDPRRAFDNADSITGYVVWGVIHGA